MHIVLSGDVLFKCLIDGVAVAIEGSQGIIGIFSSSACRRHDYDLVARSQTDPYVSRGDDVMADKVRNGSWEVTSVTSRGDDWLQRQGEPCGGCGDCRENNGENCSNPQ